MGSFTEMSQLDIDAADRASSSLYYIARRTGNTALTQQCRAMIVTLAEEFPIRGIGPAAERLLDEIIATNQ